MWKTFDCRASTRHSKFRFKAACCWFFWLNLQKLILILSSRSQGSSFFVCGTEGFFKALWCCRSCRPSSSSLPPRPDRQVISLLFSPHSRKIPGPIQRRAWAIEYWGGNYMQHSSQIGGQSTSVVHDKKRVTFIIKTF